MALGLESNIAETAKAFQGNPQALQQRYTQKQDLFDLLALNMIKKNQDAAKRSLMLSQQKMPGTVLEQVEGAVTKNAAEKVKGVAGALATKNAQTQKNMQEMAGVSGAPAPNMAKMAGGGIVGFAAGNEVRRGGGAKKTVTADMVTQEMIGKYKERQRKRGRRGNLNLSDDEIKQKIVNLENSFLGSDYFTKTPESKGGQMSRRRQDFPPEEETTQEKSTVDTGPAVDVGLQEALRKQNVKPDSGIAALPKKPVIPVDDLSQDKSGGVTAAPAFDASKFAADDAFNKQVKGGISSLINQDPSKAVEFASRTPAEQAFIDKMLKERMDMRANMMDPDKLANDSLAQMLLGARGATAGEAFRTAGLAGINADRNVENIRRSEFDALNKLFMTEADRSQSIKQKAFEGSQADKKQGVASGTSLTASEKTTALEADKLVQKISNDKIANSLRGDLNDIQKQRNSIMATGNNVKSNTQVIKLYKDTETKQILAAQKVYEAEKKNNLLKPAKERADLDRKAKERMDADIAQIRKTIALESKPFENSLKSLSTQTGGANTGGFTVKKKS